jgi:hypothetical protein
MNRKYVSGLIIVIFLVYLAVLTSIFYGFPPDLAPKPRSPTQISYFLYSGLGGVIFCTIIFGLELKDLKSTTSGENSDIWGRNDDYRFVLMGLCRLFWKWQLFL